MAGLHLMQAWRLNVQLRRSLRSPNRAKIRSIGVSMAQKLFPSAEAALDRLLREWLANIDSQSSPASDAEAGLEGS